MSERKRNPKPGGRVASPNQTARTNFVLVDHENIPLDSVAELNRDPFQVMIFIGANQKRVSVNLARTIHQLGPRAELLEISGAGRNALDFHIAFYVGHLAKDKPDSFFHIVSNDTGFDPLIRHLKSRKILAGRWSSIDEIPIVRSAKRQTPNQRAAAYREHLQAKTLTKPTTRKTLLNSVSACFHKQLANEEVTAVVEVLARSGFMSLDGERVKWSE